ncbi:amidohydrolase 2 [Cladorrhinum sp. PSN332]|nr:amidohydrolase 2 [Cladorrhinum sp. PSN332]
MPLPPLITLEEHFFTSPLPPSLSQLYSQQLSHIPSLLPKLTDLSARIRIPDMDAGQINFQIISHAPGLGSFPPLCSQRANDQLSQACKAFPKRFAGFAVLPMAEPAEAADELERAVKELGMLGALVDAHTDEGKFYDGEEEYEVFWKRAEELDVPVYLHPAWPSSNNTSSLYQGNFSEGAARSLGASGFGWHSETGLHFLRLYASGLFDRHPKLKVILGHMGEMIPFMLGRIQVLSKRWGEFERGFKQVWDENVWITTSGVWGLDPMRCILSEGNTKVSRILYSVDYPFQSNENGLEFMEELEASGLVDRQGLENIAHKNAETLFGIKLVGGGG